MQGLLKLSAHAGKINIVETINVFLLLCLSGINFCNDSEDFLLLVLLINVFLFINKKEKIDNGFFTALLFFMFLTIGQWLWLSDGSMKSSMGFFIRLVIAYLVIKNTSNFILTFLNIMLFLCIAAIFFYVFFLIFPSIEDSLFSNKHFWDNPATYEVKKSLIIFNIFREPTLDNETRGLWGLPRNPGAFWEPGAFAGYINLAIAFEVIFIKKFAGKGLIFLAALLTTFSTTGYLAAGLFFFLYFILVEPNSKRKLIITPVIFGAMIYLIFNVDFLAEKISFQTQLFIENSVYNTQSENDTRLGSAVLDFTDFQRSPVFGTGPSDETRYGKNEVLFMRTNGVTDIIVRIGVIGFIFLCWIFSKSIKAYLTASEIGRPKISAYVLLFIIFFVSLSETYFIMPFFWSLAFLEYAPPFIIEKSP